MRYIIALLVTSTAAMAEVPRVVTDIPPVHSIVSMVMGDLGAPELLLGKGADEHDFQLKPSQVTSLADAGLVVWIGPELTPWLDSALDARSVEGAVLTLFDDVGTYKINYFAGDVGIAEDQEDGHEGEAEEEGHDDHDHGAGSIDPHVWLDPSTAQWWTTLIAAELSRLDPENAATYSANAEAAKARIAVAEAEAKALLEPVKDLPFVTYHDAFGYFINYFDLTPAGTIALGDAASPGAARVSEIVNSDETTAIFCVFPETQHDPALVEMLAEEVGVKIGAALDPVGSTLEPGPDAYGTLITGLAKSIAECLAD